MGIGLKVYDIQANVIDETHLTYCTFSNFMAKLPKDKLDMYLEQGTVFLEGGWAKKMYVRLGEKKWFKQGLKDEVKWFTGDDGTVVRFYEPSLTLNQKVLIPDVAMSEIEEQFPELEKVLEDARIRVEKEEEKAWAKYEGCEKEDDDYDKEAEEEEDVFEKTCCVPSHLTRPFVVQLLKQELIPPDFKSEWAGIAIDI